MKVLLVVETSPHSGAIEVLCVSVINDDQEKDAMPRVKAAAARFGAEVFCVAPESLNDTVAYVEGEADEQNDEDDEVRLAEQRAGWSTTP